MYILYTSDPPFLRQIIEAAMHNIANHFQNQGVSDALQSYTPSDSDCIHTLRAKVMVLLDQDEVTRRRLCEFKSDLVRDWKPMCPNKANRFYEELHTELIPSWVKDEGVTLSDFIDGVRATYLAS